MSAATVAISSPESNPQRKGWSTTGCEFLVSISPSEKVWKTLSGKAFEKLRFLDKTLAQLVADKQLTLPEAKHALRLGDIDQFNLSALERLANRPPGSVELVFHHHNCQGFCLKCACGKIRARLAYFYDDHDETYFISCWDCGRGYLFSMTGKRDMREIRGPGEVYARPHSDPSFEVEADFLCRFRDGYVSAILGGQKNPKRIITGMRKLIAAELRGPA